MDDNIVVYFHLFLDIHEFFDFNVDVLFDLDVHFDIELDFFLLFVIHVFNDNDALRWIEKRKWLRRVFGTGFGLVSTSGITAITEKSGRRFCLL